jgi:competence protein ComEC
VAVLAIVLTLSCLFHIPNHNFEVISFDVGNADAFLLKSPNNKYFIIDTGKLGYNGRKSQAEIIMLKYMKDKGIKDIEGIIITHFDSDHAGGSIDLINNLKVKNVYVNSLSDNKSLAKKIYKAVDKQSGMEKHLAKNNDVIYLEHANGNDFEIRTLRADIQSHGKDSEENENSVQTLITYGKSTMLFTGDAGVRAFNKIKPDLPKNITVLKVGHHGARNVVDKEMLAYLNPEVSLVSVGYNKYGHPNPLTIKLLSNTKIVRTDRINSIKIIVNDKGYEVDGFDTRSHKYLKRFSKRF